MNNYLHSENGNPPVFDPYDDDVLKNYSDCSDYTLSQFPNQLDYFSVSNAAKDLRDTINLMGHTKVGLISLSYGTYMTNVFMQLPDIHVDVVILDGPWDPARMYMGNQGGSAITAINVIDLCISNSSVCREMLGVTSHLPTIVHTGND